MWPLCGEPRTAVLGVAMLRNGILTAQSAGSGCTTGQTGQVSEGQTLAGSVLNPDGTPHVSWAKRQTWQLVAGATATAPYSGSILSTTALYEVVASYVYGCGKDVDANTTASATVASGIGVWGDADIVTGDPAPAPPPVVNPLPQPTRDLRRSAIDRRPRETATRGHMDQLAKFGGSAGWKSPARVKRSSPLFKHALPQQ